MPGILAIAIGLQSDFLDRNRLERKFRNRRPGTESKIPMLRIDQARIAIHPQIMLSIEPRDDFRIVVGVGVEIVIGIDRRVSVRRFAGDQIFLNDHLIQIDLSDETQKNASGRNIVPDQIILAQLAFHHPNGRVALLHNPDEVV